MPSKKITKKSESSKGKNKSDNTTSIKLQQILPVRLDDKTPMDIIKN